MSKIYKIYKPEGGNFCGVLVAEIMVTDNSRQNELEPYLDKMDEDGTFFTDTCPAGQHPLCGTLVGRCGLALDQPVWTILEEEEAV